MAGELHDFSELVLVKISTLIGVKLVEELLQFAHAVEGRQDRAVGLSLIISAERRNLEWILLPWSGESFDWNIP